MEIIRVFNEYTIRKVEQEDLEKIYTMRKQVASESDTVLSTEEEITLDGIKNWINTWKDNPKRLFLVVECKGEIVGQLWVWFLDNKIKTSHVAEFGLEILRQHRGKGLGTELCKIAVEWAEKTKAVRLQAETLERNISMRKILEKLSFKIEGKMEAYFKGTDQYEDVLIYAKLFHG
ncbi:MAG: GNAT family N-acetyltransferase [Fervidobacterium sp.]